jgi:Mn-dependent DtxR family transcriptional regulator
MRWRFSAEEQNIIAKEFIQKDLIHVVANNISWFDNIDDEIIARLIKDGYISYIPKKYLVLHKK